MVFGGIVEEKYHYIKSNEKTENTEIYKRKCETDRDLQEMKDENFERGGRQEERGPSWRYSFPYIPTPVMAHS